jgi:hypothetical protein
MAASRRNVAGWNWLPPDGATPRPDLTPWWVRAWYRMPFIDRYAHAWMWHHGALEVIPADLAAGSDGDGHAGVHEPRGPAPSRPPHLPMAQPLPQDASAEDAR